MSLRQGCPASILCVVMTVKKKLRGEKVTILCLSVSHQHGSVVKSLVRLDTKDGRSQLKGHVCASISTSISHVTSNK